MQRASKERPKPGGSEECAQKLAELLADTRGRGLTSRVCRDGLVPKEALGNISQMFALHASPINIASSVRPLAGFQKLSQSEPRPNLVRKSTYDTQSNGVTRAASVKDACYYRGFKGLVRAAPSDQLGPARKHSMHAR